jgi:hypothetical protein
MRRLLFPGFSRSLQHPRILGTVWMMVRFSNKLVAELIQPFWASLQAGEFLTDAAAVAQTHRHRGLAWLREAGGVRSSSS